MTSSGAEAKRMLNAKDGEYRALVTDIDLQDQILIPMRYLSFQPARTIRI